MILSIQVTKLVSGFDISRHLVPPFEFLREPLVNLPHHALSLPLYLKPRLLPFILHCEDISSQALECKLVFEGDRARLEVRYLGDQNELAIERDACDVLLQVSAVNEGHSIEVGWLALEYLRDIEEKLKHRQTVEDPLLFCIG